MDLEKAKEALAGFAGQAEDLIKNPGKLEELLQQFEEKMKEVPVAGEALSRVPSSFTATLPEVSGTCFTVTNIFISCPPSIT